MAKRQFTEEQREAARARTAKWRAANGERKREYTRTYYARNRADLQAASRRYYAENQETIKAKWRAENPKKVRAVTCKERHRSLKKLRAGVTALERELIIAEHGEFCDICNATDPGRLGWQLDHDHGTGRIRGILCRKCNTSLGGFNDDPAALRRAAEYVERGGSFSATAA